MKPVWGAYVMAVIVSINTGHPMMLFTCHGLVYRNRQYLIVVLVVKYQTANN